jgi:uncharacterized protein (TIGR00725 family)
LSERRRLIAVCGESNPETVLGDVAFDVGRGIAQRGAVLLCGGSTGVMEHAARGARSAGGLTVGILPGDDPEAANPYVDVALATGLGQARNAVIAYSAQGVIAIGGGYGTLSEIGLAMRIGRPVIGLRTWRFERSDQVEPPLPTAATADEALAWIFSHIS